MRGQAVHPPPSGILGHRLGFARVPLGHDASTTGLAQPSQ